MTLNLTMEVYQCPGRLLLERESKGVLVLTCFSFTGFSFFPTLCGHYKLWSCFSFLEIWANINLYYVISSVYDPHVHPSLEIDIFPHACVHSLAADTRSAAFSNRHPFSWPLDLVSGRALWAFPSEVFS